MVPTGRTLRRLVHGRTVRRRIDEAMEAYAQERYAQAEVLLREAVEYGTEHGEAYYNLGVVLEALGKVEEALASYRQAVELDGSDPSYFADLAKLLHRLGRRQEAEEAYRAGIDKFPEHAILHANYGTFLRDKGRFDEADREYQLALEHADPETRKRLQEMYGV